MPETKRLFVPLASQPFEWFSAGSKRWELRRAKGAFAPTLLLAGRSVELRRGYSTPDSLFGNIGRLVTGETLEEVLDAVPYRQVIPAARSAKEAHEIAAGILGSKPGPFVAFEVVIEAL